MPILLKNLVSMGRGNDVVASLPRTIWIADQVRNDGMSCIVLDQPTKTTHLNDALATITD